MLTFVSTLHRGDGLNGSTLSSRDLNPPLQTFARAAESHLQLAFTPEFGTESTQNHKVNLISASLPGKSLLLTCRQTHNEAREFYNEACESFWRTTHFSVNAKTATYAEIEKALDHKHASKITTLTIYGCGREYVFRNGIWSCLCSDCNSGGGLQSDCPQHAIVLQGSPGIAGAIIPTKFWWRERAFRDMSDGDDPRTHFVMLLSELSKEDIEASKVAADWEGLTKKELVGIVTWYLHGY